jgi:hypothetical protein
MMIPHTTGIINGCDILKHNIPKIASAPSRMATSAALLDNSSREVAAGFVVILFPVDVGPRKDRPHPA